ncbi:MAG: methyltransferase domain-containing protein [Gemmatimonadaceae bacterium]
MTIDRIAVADAAFAGSIPEIYDRYLGPLFFEPYAEDLARRLAKLKARNVLEVAAGTGIATRRLLEALPRGAQITVTDLNQPMVDYARRAIGNDPRVTWRQADALSLPFSDQEFDAVVCQFGVMFFPDKALGLREFHRVLSKGGHLLFNVWDSFEKNPLGMIPHTTIAEFFTSDPPDFWKIPFGYYDTAEIRKRVSAAGFVDVEIDTVKVEGKSPSAADAAKGLITGTPVVNSIRERGPEKLDAIEARTSERLAKSYGTKPLCIPMQAHVISATRP